MQTAWSSVRDALRPLTDSATVAAPQAAWPAIVATLQERDPDVPALVVTATARKAEELLDQLPTWLDTSVTYLPAWETLPHERLSPSADIVGNRMAVLHSLRSSDPPGVVVAPLRALMQPLPPDILDTPPQVFRAGAELDLAATTAALVQLGYERCDLVERRGQFAVRGGIIDVFPAHEPHPVRVELWGDEVEEVRSFAVSDQRMMDTLDREVLCYPCRELLLTPEVRRRAGELAQQDTPLREELFDLSEGIFPAGAESLAPLLYGSMSSLAEFLPEGGLVVLAEPAQLEERSEETLRTAAEFASAAWSAAGTGGEAPILAGESALLPWPDISEALTQRCGTLRMLTQFGEASADQDAPIRPVGPFQGPGQAVATVEAAAAAQWRVLVAATAPGPMARLAEVLAGQGLAVRRGAEEPLHPGVVTVAVGQLSEGFRIPGSGVAVIADSDFSRRRRNRATQRSKMPSRRRGQVDPLSLQPGDFVVHEKHGVGRFVELTHRESRGATREFLVVEYAPSKRGFPPDQLFIPSDQLQSVTRYVGGESPTLSKLGGSDWAATKGRARKAVREIAGELVRLYARRQQSRGHAFAADTPWQAELEDAFEYTETADQMASIEDVKQDMERPIPMDRLICGDVGYGKTEIAVRAAFKAVQDGKQVAVLVPTTLLVQQHLATFSERFSGFPVRVEALSRFQSASQVNKVVAGVGEGSVDIVIGTHRLLTPDIRFKDLGLVIVDEEQRFGVEQKEHLKALRANVDTLTMSATPIPRTLEMAVTGIREMSTIATPPEERLPVLTYVGPYDKQQVRAAIHRELMREGQVFFVHNRVKSIDSVARQLRELVPEARIAVAHGQMNESALEQIVLDFWNGEIDVLVCTTIVESGIDIANANTLIVDRADAFGLSQLHQLRGRVGRSRSRAYAYFLYSPDRTLSETAHERLATIAQNTDLGSGMQVALKDLEIRGAGNLLGGEQSGHIADVGFDLYVRMVGEALAEVKGEAGESPAEMRVDLPVDAHLSPAYIPEERLRLEAYQRLAAATDSAAVDEVVAELADRYGPLPPEAQNLVAVARFRLLARACGLQEVVAAGERVRLYPVELPDSRRVRLNRLYPGAIYKAPTRQVLVPMPDGDALEWATDLLRTLFDV